MASRRSRSTVRISFFSFQDIITATTCILILVTMMLSTFLGGNQGTERYVAESTRDLDIKLRELLEKLTTVTSTNEDMARRMTELPAGGVEALKQEVEKMKEELAKLQAELNSGEEQDTQSAKQQAEKDNSHGIAVTAREVEAMRKAVDDMKDKADALQGRAEEAEKKVRRADTKLLEAQRARTSLWLVPENSTTTKEPILIVVDRNGLTLERFNKPEDKVTIQNQSLQETLTTFRAQLAKMDRLSEYLVFYIKPSGIGLYKKVQVIARETGFEIGYDALEEDVTIVFSAPTREEAP